jgi:ribulose kinase
VRPGALAFLTGSSHLQLGLSATPLHGEGVWGTYADGLIPGLHVVEGGQTSTGSIINWYKNMLGDDATYEMLNNEAAKITPGCDGLVVQDHFQGNRTPYTDPLSRGAITGLTLKHTRGHIFRAIIEGIAFGSELIFETMRNSGFAIDDVVIAGGATRSDLWLQIHADVSGIPLRVTGVPDAPGLGCAILAATSVGEFDTIVEAADHMVKKGRIIEPDMQAHEAYRPIFAAYKQAYPALKSIGVA